MARGRATRWPALSDEALSDKLVDDLLARMLTAPPAARRSKGRVAPLVPAAHGVLALITILLAMLTAATAR